jgi:membrane-associated phospholipid phosphatase
MDSSTFLQDNKPKATIHSSYKEWKKPTKWQWWRQSTCRLVALGKRHVADVFHRHEWKPLCWGILPILWWLIIYEISAAIPAEYRPRIHVRLLSNIEEILLGGRRNLFYLPHEALSERATLAKDIFACIAYSLHALLPWAMFFYLCCFRSWTHAAHFCWTFGWLNIVAVVSHFFLPTAAPWYIKEYGLLDAHYNVSGSAAGLIRIDKALGFPVFESLYKRNKVVFGSFPSLHVAWPSLIALYEPFPRLLGGIVPWLYVVWVGWAALYLEHHYLVDWIGGCLYAYSVFCYFQGQLYRKDCRNVA